MTSFTQDQIKLSASIEKLANIAGLEFDCFKRGDNLEVIVNEPIDNNDDTKYNTIYHGPNLDASLVVINDHIETSKTLSAKAYRFSRQFPTKSGYASFIISMISDASDSEREIYARYIGFKRGGSIEKMKTLIGNRWDDAKPLRAARRADHKKAVAESNSRAVEYCVTQVIERAMTAAAEMKVAIAVQNELFA